MELYLFLLGILASVLGFWFLNYIYIPLRGFKELKAKIGRNCLYYSHIITSPEPGALADEASTLLRGLAVELEEKYLLIPMRWLLTFIHLIPSAEFVKFAKGSLIFASNNVMNKGQTDNNCRALEEIYTALNIKELEGRYNLRYATAVEMRKIRMGEKYTPKIIDKITYK